jgi:hypothetical protein
LALKEEIDAGRATVKADSLSMSIGEVVNLYKSRELVIRPEFQRLFRWTSDKKSRLIESILLGIPLPSIFVMQRHDGIWEVIDGLQRISTILEFMGELLNEETGEIKPPSVLQGTRYLPSLAGARYESNEGPTLDSGQRISFKRSKMDFKILLPESDTKAKYELFDRLNSGGQEVSAQEVRNCLLLMSNRGFFHWLSGLAENENFTSCAMLSSRKEEQQYHLELICRFLTLYRSTEDELRKMESVDTFLTDRILAASDDEDYPMAEMEELFLKVFSVLSESLESQTFRRYDPDKDRYTGGFSVSAFEAITIGLASNMKVWERLEKDDRERLITEKVLSLWSNPAFKVRAKAGVRGTTRIPNLIPAAREHFRI